MQRLWWALLLCVAFFGIVRLRRAAAASARRCTRVARRRSPSRSRPRFTTPARRRSRWRSGRWRSRRGCSLPLVRGSTRARCAGRPRVSALVVACAAASTPPPSLAVLPLGALWLLDPRVPARGAGGCWAGGRCSPCAATAWWLVPLLLLGRYSPPFLDYIENAADHHHPDRPDPHPARASRTGSPTSAARTARPWHGGWRRPPYPWSTPPLVVAGLGLAGLACRGHAAPAVPGLGPAGRAGPGRLRAPRPLGRVRRATAAQLPRRRAGPVAQRAQVRRGAADPADPRPGPPGRAGAAGRPHRPPAGTGASAALGAPAGPAAAGVVAGTALVAVAAVSPRPRWAAGWPPRAASRAYPATGSRRRTGSTGRSATTGCWWCRPPGSPATSGAAPATRSPSRCRTGRGRSAARCRSPRPAPSGCWTPSNRRWPTGRAPPVSPTCSPAPG